MIEFKRIQINNWHHGVHRFKNTLTFSHDYMKIAIAKLMTTGGNKTECCTSCEGEAVCHMEVKVNIGRTGNVTNAYKRTLSLCGKCYGENNQVTDKKMLKARIAMEPMEHSSYPFKITNDLVPFLITGEFVNSNAAADLCQTCLHQKKYVKPLRELTVNALRDYSLTHLLCDGCYKSYAIAISEFLGVVEGDFWISLVGEVKLRPKREEGQND